MLSWQPQAAALLHPAASMGQAWAGWQKHEDGSMAAKILVWDLPGQHWWATGSCRASASGRLTSSKKPGVQTSVVMPSGHDGVLGRCSGLSVMSRYCTSTQRGSQHLRLGASMPGAQHHNSEGAHCRSHHMLAAQRPLSPWPPVHVTQNRLNIRCQPKQAARCETIAYAVK